jgi:SulP family sulfate permease
VRSQDAVPAVGWLPTYRRAWLRGDVVGGITAGLVVVPQAMAYATIADLPVQVGLYTCMVPMAVYALLGGSRVLSVSTTSTIATLTASTLVAAGVAADSASADDALDSLATLVLLTGLVLLLARLFRLGPLIDNISEAIIIGLKVGVGLTVAASQLPKLLGIASDPDADTFVEELPYALRHLGDRQRRHSPVVDRDDRVAARVRAAGPGRARPADRRGRRDPAGGAVRPRR